jgi:acetyl-CoA carboxylase carboxyltransferase component
MTARERILALLDPGSFSEFGALAHSEREAIADRSPGDGKIIGLGMINGRKVGVGADDITVFHASSSYVGMKKVDCLEKMCFKHGFPFIFLGECGARSSYDRWSMPAAIASHGQSLNGPSWHGRSGCRNRENPRIRDFVPLSTMRL